MKICFTKLFRMHISITWGLIKGIEANSVRIWSAVAKLPLSRVVSSPSAAGEV